MPSQKNQTSVYLFIISIALIVLGAALFIWSDYTSNGVLGAKAEVVSYVLVALGAIGLAVNYFKD